jgi:hypothetical protein
MRPDLELALAFEADRWIARGPGVTASGRTLAELDADVARALRAAGRFGGGRVTVFMGFDFDTLPVWMRQYAAHYFNRTLRLDL